MALVDDIHANSKIEEVLLAKLRVDHSYQRDISERLVDDIAGNFDVIAAELITVSNRGTRNGSDVDGGLWIVNGQHRSKAAQKTGRDTIWARVIDLRKFDDPGAIEAGFRLKTNVKLSDRPLERFRAQIRSGDQESQEIVAILAKFDSEINVTPNSEVGINCVSTIEQIYRLDQGALLSEVLEIIKDAWKHVGGKYTQAAILKGLAWFVEKHAEESQRPRLVEKLSIMGIGALETRSRTIGLTMGGSLWVNYYRGIVDVYNEGLREKNRLQWMMRGASSLSRGGGGVGGATTYDG